MRKKKEVGETFHTFLQPVIILHKDVKYYIYGYRAIDGEIVSISATTDEEVPWTRAIAFTDKALIDLLTKSLN